MAILFRIPSCLAVLAVMASLLEMVRAGKQHALLIGNEAYTKITRLANPVRDVTALERVLRASGWNTEQAANQTKEEMATTISRFLETNASADAAIIYYAGHGFEVEGENYLAGVDMVFPETKGDIAPYALGLSKVINLFRGKSPKLKILMLDCCRNNPLASRSVNEFTRNIGDGLADLDSSMLPAGTLIAFSGAPGKQVPDGVSGQGPYAMALLKAMVPGVDAFTMLSKTGKYCNEGQEPYLRFDASAKMLLQFQELIVVPQSVGPLPKPLDLVSEIEELRKRLADAEAKQSKPPVTKPLPLTKPVAIPTPPVQSSPKPVATPPAPTQSPTNGSALVKPSPKPKPAADDWRKIAEDFEKR